MAASAQADRLADARRRPHRPPPGRRTTTASPGARAASPPSTSSRPPSCATTGRPPCPRSPSADTVVIDGITYEEDLTSGGAADLPAALEGRVRNLDYKTLRYPGHYAWVERTPGRGAGREDATGRIAYLQAKMDGDGPLRGGRPGGDLRRRRRPRRRRHPAPLGEVAPHPPPPGGRPHAQGDPETTTAGLAESARFLLMEAPRGSACKARSIRPTSWPARSWPRSITADPALIWQPLTST